MSNMQQDTHIEIKSTELGWSCSNYIFIIPITGNNNMILECSIDHYNICFISFFLLMATLLIKQ